MTGSWFLLRGVGVVEVSKLTKAVYIYVSRIEAPLSSHASAVRRVTRMSYSTRKDMTTSPALAIVELEKEAAL